MNLKFDLFEKCIKNRGKLFFEFFVYMFKVKYYDILKIILLIKNWVGIYFNKYIL